MRYKRKAKRNIGIEIDPEVVEIWNNRDQVNFELINGDAITFLKSYPFTGKELVYCDPPYIRETRKNNYLYINMNIA
jgi:N6-adenine-specific methylase